MSAINLPVRPLTVDDGADEWVCLVDAEDNRLDPHDIAEFLNVAPARLAGLRCEIDRLKAALNAAPKRALEELTAEKFGEIIRKAGRDVIAALGRRPKIGDASSWDMRANEFLLSRLQGLAAPVIPEGWTLVPVEPTEAMGIAGETVVIGDGGALDVWEEMLNASPPARLRTEAAVRAEAQREALEESGKACALLAESFTGHAAAGALQCRDAIRALIDRP